MFCTLWGPKKKNELLSAHMLHISLHQVPHKNLCPLIKIQLVVKELRSMYKDTSGLAKHINNR